MKIKLLLLLIFSNFCFGQNNTYSPDQYAGTCHGFHVFWSGLSEQVGKNNNKQCSLKTMKTLNAKYRNNLDFQEYSSRANDTLINAYQQGNSEIIRFGASVCTTIGVTTCFIQ